jgi:phenylacetate-coenzyme A ligase PaaK-like adenylate-forming protein
MNEVTSPFSLPDILRQPQDRVRALQNRLLRETIELCYKSHPYYSKLMRREGLEPRHIQSSDDLRRLPPTAKQDFLSDPDAFRINPDDLPPDQGTLWKVIYTTGTTSGRPAPVYVAAYDHFAYLYACSQRQELIGLNAADRVANLFPLTPFPMGAYARAADEMAAVGASIFFAQTGRPDDAFPVHRSLDEAVAAIARHRATVLWGVAGFVRRVLMRAQEVNADFTSVRMVMITGEASSSAMRDDLRRRMRELGCADTRIANRYGSTEQGGSMVECQPGAGFHSLAPDQIFHEVVNPGTGERLADGETGMLAFTHLMRRGTLFLRYKVGDVVSMTTATCPHCGRTSPRITSQPVRTGDIVKIKGTLVNLQILKERLDTFSALDEYQIVVQPVDARDPFSMDELVIRIAVAPGQSDDIAARVIEETTALAHMRPRVETVERDEIYDPLVAAKPRRVVDIRPPRN